MNNNFDKITLPTKIHTVKAFPVVLYGYESWTTRKTAAAATESLQSCSTLCDPIDGSPPGSPIPGILQARTLQWVAISFSNAWKWKVKVKSLSCVRLLATSWTAAHQAPPSVGFSRQEHWSGVPLPSPRKTECHRVDAFKLWCWRLLRVPWTARKSNQSILKEISPEYSLEGLMLKLKFQYFGHLMRRADSLEKTLKKLRAGEGGDRGWDGWIVSLSQWTWGWANPRKWWRTGKPGVLQSTRSQRARHNWGANIHTHKHTHTQTHTHTSYMQQYGWIHRHSERKKPATKENVLCGFIYE